MKKPLFLSSSLLGGLIVCLAAAPALAQESTSPSAAPMSPPPGSSGTSMGGGTIGIGAVTWLSPLLSTNVATPGGGAVAGPGGAGEFVYDMPSFHLEAALGITHYSPSGAGMASTTGFALGVAGWYHLAKGASADFSIGGGAGLDYTSTSMGGPSATAFALEPGIEARAFLSPNFAVTLRAGFAILFGDNNTPTIFTLGGQGSGEFGFVYFFR